MRANGESSTKTCIEIYQLTMVSIDSRVGIPWCVLDVGIGGGSLCCYQVCLQVQKCLGVGPVLKCGGHGVGGGKSVNR